MESHHVIREANRAFGPAGWNYSIKELNLVCPPYKNDKDNTCLTYIAVVTVTVGKVTREDTGTGHGIGRDEGACHERATKEAVSDAMKRALRTFGDIFGLALYDPEQRNVISYTDQEMNTAFAKIQACESVEELQFFKTLPVDLKAAVKDAAIKRHAEITATHTQIGEVHANDN